MRFYVSEKLSDNMAETPEGYLICMNVPITRTGEFLYRGDELLGEDGTSIVEPLDGIVRIQRDADNVLAEDTIRSFEGKPFTLDHPEGFVSPENWQELSHGTVQNVHAGEGEFDGFLLADILVTTEKAKELIRAGEREISCGYDAEYEQVEKGIGRQTNIIGNHVALVSKGRAGSRCAIVDSDGTSAGICTRIDIKNHEKTEEEDEMANKKKQPFVDKMKEWFNKRPFKDEDDLEEKLKAELDDDPDKKKTEDEDEDEDLDKKGKKEFEDDDDIEALKTELAELKENSASLAEKVDGILAILEELLEAEDEDISTEDDDSEEEDDPDKKKTEDEDEDDDDPDKKKTEDEDEEEEEKKEAERKEVEDAWPAILSHADILVPGIKLNKPTKDHMTQLDGIRASVLSKAASDSEYGAEVQKLCTSSSFKTMTHDALGVAFVAASQLVGNIRNAKIQQGSYIQKSTKDHKFGTAQVIADINRRNREKYANK